MFFSVLMALFKISLNFLRCNLPKFSQNIAFSGIRNLNTKKVVKFVKAFFFSFANLCLPFREKMVL